MPGTLASEKGRDMDQTTGIIQHHTPGVWEIGGAFFSRAGMHALHDEIGRILGMEVPTPSAPLTASATASRVGDEADG